MATHLGARGYVELREAAALAEAAAAAARAAADEAARAVQAHPLHGLADSPFALLDAHSSLRLVTEMIREDDALCLALTCRPLRDALWARFPRVPCDRAKLNGEFATGCKGTYAATTTRLRTRDAVVVATVARFVWALAQPQRPSWLCHPSGGEHAPEHCCAWAKASAESLLHRGATTADESTVRYNAASDRAQLQTPRKQLATAAVRRAAAIAMSSSPIMKRLGLYKRAAAAGALGTLQWLAKCASSFSLNGWRQDCEFSAEKFKAAEICAAAAEGGHLAVLQWLRANDEWDGHSCEWDEQTCVGAAQGGHLAVLQWARANGCEWDADTCSSAAQGGHLATLQWARANGCEWGELTCPAAAYGGHLAVLQWARANGCEWDADTCLNAAQCGHLAVLQWARENGCEWDEGTCRDAAYGGHLAVLQWARLNGCPWDAETCLAAAERGHLAILQWARANDCPWSREDCLCDASDADMTEWIERQPA
jgi:hypothetical protein